MKESTIKKILQEKLNLKEEPKIIFSHQRKLSLICGIKGDKEDYILKIRKEKKERFNKQTIEEIKKRISKEWESLKYFYEITKDEECSASFPKPIIYIPEIGGVVMEKASGEDLSNLLKKNNADRETLKQIGRSLSFLHYKDKVGEKEVEFNQKSVGNKRLDQKIESIFKKAKAYYYPVSKTMSGFDIRDILITKERSIYFVDPGRRKERYIYNALAGIIVNMKILYQGSILFPFKKIEKEYENALIEGYFENKEYSKKLLGLLVLSGLTKFYCITINKKLPNIPLLKNILIRLYLNPFYHREIERTIKDYELE